MMPLIAPHAPPASRTVTMPAATIQGGWEDFAAGLNLAGIGHVVASYKEADFAEILSYEVPTVLQTQRRRQSRLS